MMLKSTLFAVAVILVASSGAFAQSTGATVVKPTGATASDTYSGYVPGLTVDGSGLSATLNTGDAATSVSGVTAQGAASTTGWDSNSQTTGAWLRVDLGSELDNLEGLWVWNGINSGTNGSTITGLTVAVADSGMSFSDVDSFSITPVAPSSTSTGQFLDFGGLQDSVQYVRLTVDSVNSGSGYTGLREVRASQAVPEPASMTLLALGGLAMLKRRRRK